jgi:uncharacterized protein YndB with AHSA1/START domain
MAGEPSPLVVERRVAAAPDAVYAYLTDAERWARWQGEEATIDAQPGGLFRVRMGNGMCARGQFVELVPDKRVVFTWGWIDLPDLPPGSTIVEIELTDEGDSTLIRLTHREMPDHHRAPHLVGWQHYVARLGMCAAGGDPGPDPGAGG